MTGYAQRVLGLIDLTSLGDHDQAADIDALCAAATTSFGTVAAVCIWPEFVGQASELLSGRPIEIAAVANFPFGHESPQRAAGDARRIVAAGGTEVDVVFPWRSLAAGRVGVGRKLVEATRDAIGDSTTLKVILETGELLDTDLIRAAANEALDGGADFLKTSTGKTVHSATLAAARTLLETIAERGAQAGVKIAGGIRTVEHAAPYLDLADEVFGPDWVTAETFRIGASSLLGDVIQAISESPASEQERRTG